jgi:hypothetical protein
MYKWLYPLILAKLCHTSSLATLVLRNGTEMHERVISMNDPIGRYKIFDVEFSIKDIKRIDISDLFIKIYLY